jgi:hypothetical protein
LFYHKTELGAVSPHIAEHTNEWFDEGGNDSRRTEEQTDLCICEVKIAEGFDEEAN